MTFPRLAILPLAALVATLVAMPSKAEPTGPIIVVAHVDFIPDFLAQGLPAMQQFVVQSQNDPGVKSFTLITWAPTTNHFQLIEIYESRAAFDSHVQAAHTIAFRSAIQPLIGAPYDERLYVANGQ